MSNATTENEKKQYYVSVTGLEVKSIFYFPLFARHAAPSKMQADAAEGNVSSQTTARGYVQHTLTVWKDKKSMLRYLISGAHLQAMNAADSMSRPGGTKVYGYYSDTIPTWDEALALWEEHGTRHGKKVTRQQPKQQLSSALLLGVAVSVALMVAAAVHLQDHINEPSGGLVA